MKHDWRPHKAEAMKDQFVDVEKCSRCDCVRSDRGGMEEIFKDERWWWHARVAWTECLDAPFADEDCAAEVVRAVMSA